MSVVQERAGQPPGHAGRERAMIWPYIAIVAALLFGLTLGVLLMFLLQARAGEQ